MAKMDTAKATTIPTSRTANSVPVKANPNFNSLIRLAPNITGIARKKVNSAAISLEAPIRIPPMMVEPEREVPGIRERTWNTPTKKASLKDKSCKVLILGLRFFF